MQIVVSGKFSSDVAESARDFTNELRDRVQQVDLSEVEAALESIVYFPVIVSDELGVPTKSHRSFSSKERAEFVNVEIPHGVWVNADDDLRRKLLENGLLQAVRETSEARLPDESKRQLVRKLNL